jgi:hypothetical protein
MIEDPHSTYNEKEASHPFLMQLPLILHTKILSFGRWLHAR